METDMLLLSATPTMYVMNRLHQVQEVAEDTREAPLPHMATEQAKLDKV